MIEEIFALVLHRHPHIIAFEGIAGVGKTTLINKFREACRDLGMKVSYIHDDFPPPPAANDELRELHYMVQGVEAAQRIAEKVHDGETTYLLIDRYLGSQWVYAVPHLRSYVHRFVDALPKPDFWVYIEPGPPATRQEEDSEELVSRYEMFWNMRQEPVIRAAYHPEWEDIVEEVMRMVEDE